MGRSFIFCTNFLCSAISRWKFTVKIKAKYLIFWVSNKSWWTQLNPLFSNTKILFLSEEVNEWYHLPHFTGIRYHDSVTVNYTKSRTLRKNSFKGGVERWSLLKSVLFNIYFSFLIIAEGQIWCNLSCILDFTNRQNLVSATHKPYICSRLGFLYFYCAVPSWHWVLKWLQLSQENQTTLNLKFMFSNRWKS